MSGKPPNLESLSVQEGGPGPAPGHQEITYLRSLFIPPALTFPSFILIWQRG